MRTTILSLVALSALAHAAGEPRPDAAMDVYKTWIGSATCTGVVKVMGRDVKDKSTAKFSWDLDNYWVKFDFVEAKTKDNANPNHTLAYYGYDPAAKEYVVHGVDNMGASFSATSKGPSDNKIVFEGTGKWMGMDEAYKETQTLDGDAKTKKLHVSGAMGPTGFPPDKTVTWELDCSR